MRVPLYNVIVERRSQGLILHGCKTQLSSNRLTTPLQQSNGRRDIS
jgi:hypothetical protein